jgi:DNA-binding LacI/PurR family transcriptional regulator
MSQDKPTQEIEIDGVVIATGLIANSETVEILREAGPPVVVIGDAGGVGYLDGAIEDGFKAAIALN